MQILSRSYHWIVSHSRLGETVDRVLRLWRHLGFVAVLRKIREKVLKWARTIFKLVSPDLSWEAFQVQVLAKRYLYKGIFIQEPVLDWNVTLYQRPQHIAVALGKSGYLVIYKTPGNFDVVRGFQQVAQNVWLTNNLNLQIPESFFSVYSSTAYGTKKSILANHWENNSVFVYEYIDHVTPLINGENTARLIEVKEFAFQHADFIVTSARQLEQEAVNAVGREKVIYIPNGVDISHYRNPVYRTVKLPRSFEKFRNYYDTVVGYFGAIAPWLWYEMIDELTAMRPEIGFVFIGPDYYKGSDYLPKRENLIYLGSVAYKVLPSYARLFDVCFIPFAPGEIARTTSPLKLFEYFALEKPVVVTSFMDECLAYEEVFFGDSTSTLADAIEQAIKVKDNLAYKKRLATLAEKNSWDERVKRYEKIFQCCPKSKGSGTDLSVSSN